MIRTLNVDIYSRILTDKHLSLDLATALNIKQYSVEQLARRGSDKLLNINAIEVFRKHGLTDDEIFQIVSTTS